MRNQHSRPRSISGGYSPRYERRRELRGSDAAYAPGWNDASARAVMNALQAKGSRKITAAAKEALLDDAAARRLLKEIKRHVTASDVELVRSILAFHADLVRPLAAQGTDCRAKLKSFLKPLYDRRVARSKLVPLEVEPAESGPATFHEWLSSDLRRDRQRDISRCKRILKGVKTWPLKWLKKPGVVCYERAHNRIENERGGHPDAAFMKGVVRTTELPTAVANAGDHYVLLRPKGEPRFLTVEEVARAFGVPGESPLMRTLRSKTVLTCNQAVSCLGRSVHVLVAYQIVKMLAQRGLLLPGLTYGTAYTGLDLFAAAVEMYFGNEWRYSHASESAAHVRKALLNAWGCRGLTEATCHRDARGDAATHAPTVDLFVHTSVCEPHSKRNHGRTCTAQATALTDVERSLTYVREQKPRVAVLENVNEPSAVGAMSGLLSRIQGYESVEEGALTPQGTARVPMARERHFWVLVRKAGH